LHIKQWPEVLAGISLQGKVLKAVAVSASPRPHRDSYMPVFLAGYSFAGSLAHGAGVPLYTFSHQEGHLRAALSRLHRQPTEDFLAVQMSGGTTDVLYVSRGAAGGYALRVLAASVDLHAGQFIDRVGVAMGAEFPCGTVLDKLAENHSGAPYAIPAAVKNGEISFAGPATAALRALERGVPREAVAAGVFRCIANSLEKVLRQNIQAHHLRTVVLCGGVAANTHIRTRLAARMTGINILAAPLGLAGDNAVGTALLGVDKYAHWQGGIFDGSNHRR
jgi:N6-L-threonylcarbamoyladenine synthase